MRDTKQEDNGYVSLKNPQKTSRKAKPGYVNTKQRVCCTQHARAGYTLYLWAATPYNISTGEMTHDNRTFLLPPASAPGLGLPLPQVGVMLLLGNGQSPVDPSVSVCVCICVCVCVCRCVCTCVPQAHSACTHTVCVCVRARAPPLCVLLSPEPLHLLPFVLHCNVLCADFGGCTSS